MMIFRGLSGLANQPLRGQGLRGAGGEILNFFSGGLLDATGQLANDSCAQQAAGSMGALDANINDVQDNWNTTGFYTPDQMAQINTYGLDVIQKAGDSVRAAISQMQLPNHRDALMKALDNLHDDLIDPMPYVRAVNEAKQKNIRVIESTGYKRWIVNVLKAARNASFVTTMVQCARPEMLFSVLQALNNAADTMVAFVKSVGQLIKNVGELALKIPDAIGSFLTFLKYLPWFVLAFGGYYIAVKTKSIPEKYDPLRLRERETFRPWRRLPPGG